MNIEVLSRHASFIVESGSRGWIQAGRIISTQLRGSLAEQWWHRCASLRARKLANRSPATVKGHGDAGHLMVIHDLLFSRWRRISMRF
jgi:hypothetical protein